VYPKRYRQYDGVNAREARHIAGTFGTKGFRSVDEWLMRRHNAYMKGVTRG
jgi:hypothetical protein